MTVASKNLFGALMIAGGLFLALGFVFPSYQHTRALQTAATERKELLAGRNATISKLKNLGLEYDQRKAEIETFTTVIPGKKGTAELVAAVESIADGSGVQLSGMSVTPVAPMAQAAGTPAGPTLTLEVEIDAKGSYASMVAFLDNIEKNIRLLDVTSVLAGTDSAARGTLLTFSIKANAYFLK